MNIQHNKVLREKLSAAFVLGTLKGGARRRFAVLVKQSAILQGEVAEWEARLNPLAEFAGQAMPPVQVWQHIARRLSLTGTDTQSQKTSWLHFGGSLNFWRGLGLISTALATILVAVLLTKQPETITVMPSYMALLVNDKAQPNMVVVGDARHHSLTVKILAGQSIAADKSLELWAIPKKGAPKSLGLLAKNGAITLALPDNATPQNVAMLAVSLEPLHGSPNPDGPTGPVLFTGAWQQI
jgi:anti-sigma-K factor RskA